MSERTEGLSPAALRKKTRAQITIVDSHRVQIEFMRECGKKSSEIAVWLQQQFGFEGTGATLNGLMGWGASVSDYAFKPNIKRAGRPRVFKDAAARVKAFRSKAGKRYDIHLTDQAVVIMQRFQAESGLSASAVVDALLRGKLSIPASQNNEQK